jgi:hypothetical protein
MMPLSFAERVVRLEKQMSALQHLPKKVDDLALQVSQLHSEMTGEFSAIRHEMDAQSATLRGEMATRDEVAAGFAAVRADMAEGFTAPTGALARAVAGLREEIRAGDEETRRQMRVLHEDLVGRIALVQEGLTPAKRRQTTKRRRR